MPRTFKNEMILFFHGFTDDYRKGECYEQGLHFTKDIHAALDCYREAAKRAHINAYLKLGQLYENMQHESSHHEQKQDEQNASKYVDQALRAYLDAALQGNVEGKNHLLRLAHLDNSTAEYYCGALAQHEKNWITAQEWYLKAAAKNHAVAMYVLGCLYEQNRLSADSQIVIAKNLDTELQWYRKAAAHYSAHALDTLMRQASVEAKAALHLAQMYELGEGISKNLSRAIEFYHRASDLGDADAAFRLAQCYEAGNID